MKSIFCYELIDCGALLLRLRLRCFKQHAWVSLTRRRLSVLDNSFQIRIEMTFRYLARDAYFYYLLYARYKAEVETRRRRSGNRRVRTVERHRYSEFATEKRIYER